MMLLRMGGSFEEKPSSSAMHRHQPQFQLGRTLNV
jgi:hypothetical protein